MVTRVRNRACVPFIGSEGVFVKPIIAAGHTKDDCEGFSPSQRMHCHQTLASARRYAHFKPFSGLLPDDHLDYTLSAQYDHTEELFPDEPDVYLQPETLGVVTWRRLRNTRDLTPNREEQAAKDMEDFKLMEAREKKSKKRKGVIPFRYNFAHKVLIGGVTEKKHPSNIKLMNSSHHSPQTNAGYSRQPSDGNPYQY